MAISCLGFNTIALFSRQIFKIDDAPVCASLIFWFCFAEMICSVPRNSPMGDYQNIWLRGEHSEPIGTIRTLAYGPTQKRPPSVQAVFQVAPTPISSRFLCPSPPLLLSAPNQNRHATQAKSQIVRRPLQSFIPCLISLLVNVKLKPEIISHGDRQLIVNTTILETWPLEES